MKIHEDGDSIPEAVDAFRIYAEFWHLVANKESAIDDAAWRLQSLIVSNDDPEVCIYSSVDALRYFSREDPSAIDFGLDIFHKAAAKSLQSVQHAHGNGSAGAENILKWYMAESSTSFQGNVHPQELGKADVQNARAINASNIIFTQSDIKPAQSEVLQKLEDWKKDRLDIIVILTMLGQCHSKRFARLNRGGHMGDRALVTINNMLDRQRSGTPLWSNADFTGCCVVLNTCAK